MCVYRGYLTLLAIKLNPRPPGCPSDPLLRAVIAKKLFVFCESVMHSIGPRLTVNVFGFSFVYGLGWKILLFQDEIPIIYANFKRKRPLPAFVRNPLETSSNREEISIKKTSKFFTEPKDR